MNRSTAQQAIALKSPAPTATNAGSDTPLIFSDQINHLLVQNNTSVAVYVEVEAIASTASLQLPPGSVFTDEIEMLGLHLYTAAAQNINVLGGIIVRGWR